LADAIAYLGASSKQFNSLTLDPFLAAMAVLS